MSAEARKKAKRGFRTPGELLDGYVPDIPVTAAASDDKPGVLHRAVAELGNKLHDTAMRRAGNIPLMEKTAQKTCSGRKSGIDRFKHSGIKGQ